MFFVTKSSRETEKLGEILGKSLDKGVVLALEGDLGGGKTTFVKGLARGLGIKKTVTSPTFLIIKKYENKKSKGKIKRFYHIDCYRADRSAKLAGLGLVEILADREALVAIEWPNKIRKFLPRKKISVRFRWLAETRRRIEVTA